MGYLNDEIIKTHGKMQRLVRPTCCSPITGTSSGSGFALLLLECETRTFPSNTKYSQGKGNRRTLQLPTI